MKDAPFDEMTIIVEGLEGIDTTKRADRRVATNLVHGYNEGDEATGSISTPIYPAVAFTHPGFDDSTGYFYGRVGNPTRLELEDTLTMLEGGKKSFAYTSGMTAISTLIKLLVPGDHVVLGDDLYGGTYRTFTDIYGRYGITSEYIDMTNLELVRERAKGAKAIFIETPTNPMMKVVDLQAVADIAHEAGALFIVDNTFLTPYFQRPFDYGADIVLHSGTKFLAGHNDLMAGFIVLRDGHLIEPLFNYTMAEGGVLSPFDSWLLLRSIKTLSVRMDRQQANAIEIAKFLKAHPHVTDVYYVGDPDHPAYDLSCKQTTGFGSMISFRLDNEDRIRTSLERIKVISYAESLGAVESLMTFPYLQTHGSMPIEMRDALGIDTRLLRLSVGIEDVNDLIADLDQALA